MHQDLDGSINENPLDSVGYMPASVPVAVVPFSTAEQAKAFVRVCNMTHKKRAEIVAKAVGEMQGDPSCWLSYLVDARHVLSALSFPHGEQRK